MRRCVAGLVALVLSFHSLFAAAAPSPTGPVLVCDKPFMVLFSNGIQNDPDDAIASMAVLQDRLPGILGSQRFSIRSVYHAGNSFLQDLAEVFTQKANEQKYDDASFSEKVRAWFGLANAGAPALDEFFRDWSDYLKQGLVDVTKQLVESSADQRIALEVQKDVALMTKLLHGGSKLMVISHSQGNLYANMAYEALQAGPLAQDATERVGLVAVATPASLTYLEGAVSTDRTLYVTRDDDGVIGALRLVTFLDPFRSMPLPANVAGDQVASVEFLAHNFVNAYLNRDSEVSVRTESLIQQEASRLLNRPVEHLAATLEMVVQFPTLSPYMVEDLPPEERRYMPDSGKLLAIDSMRVVGNTLVHTSRYFCEGLREASGSSTLFGGFWFDLTYPPSAFTVRVVLGEELREAAMPLNIVSTDGETGWLVFDQLRVVENRDDQVWLSAF